VFELKQRLLLHVTRLLERVLPEEQQLAVGKQVSQEQVLQGEEHGHALAPALLSRHLQQLVEVLRAVYGALLHEQREGCNAVAHGALHTR